MYVQIGDKQESIMQESLSEIFPELFGDQTQTDSGNVKPQSSTNKKPGGKRNRGNVLNMMDDQFVQI